MAKTVTRKIADLTKGFFVRARLNDNHVMMLADVIENGGALPSITIDKDGNIIDGRHRLAAHDLCGKTEIECVVKDFETITDAIVFAFASNVGGPLPPTKADIDHTVKILLQAGVSGKKIVEDLSTCVPLPAKLLAAHISKVRKGIKRAAVERAVRAVTAGKTVVDAARENSVEIDDVRAAISRNAAPQLDGPNDVGRVTGTLSKMGRSHARKSGHLCATAVEQYASGAVDTQYVEEVLKKQEDLVKRLVASLRDHWDRFEKHAASADPNYKPRKHYFSKGSAEKSPPAEKSTKPVKESPAKKSAQEKAADVNAVLRKMGYK